MEIFSDCFLSSIYSRSLLKKFLNCFSCIIEIINQKSPNITQMYFILSVIILQENNGKYHRFSCTIENIKKIV